MAIELTGRRIPYEQQQSLEVDYKGIPVGNGRLDFLVDNRLIVELKAVECLLPIHHAQILSYLKGMRLPLGLLINFNVLRLKDGIKRIVRSTPLP